MKEFLNIDCGGGQSPITGIVSRHTSWKGLECNVEFFFLFSREQFSFRRIRPRKFITIVERETSHLILSHLR